uniref:Cytosol non-specific dipeptidase n=1 Tax=Eiseniibacteriota bacterium TaxID=2212470 RepID=A0A832MNY0_UNCEI
MSDAIRGLEPGLVWKYFAELSAHPRCSKHEEQVAAWVMSVARGLGLEAVRDRAGNVIARKPASPGHEGAPSVCLQGHLDMVCEKRPDVRHDFAKDPIRLVRQGDWLMADGTTLGADNGIAVATSLAIMADRSLEHGPLEFLFTLDEETGLTGANHLEPGLLRSRILLNLDSEEEGALFVGCSGGRDTLATWPLATERAPAAHAPVEITVGGLRGGHSGLEIDKGRGNAVKILNRLILAIVPLGARLARLDGGDKRNAIPRDATALAFVPRRRFDEAMGTLHALGEAIRAELATVEPGLRITPAAVRAKGGRVLTRALQRRVTLALSALPHGVVKMSADIPGLVETSTNVAAIRTTKKDIRVSTSQRSSVASEIEEIVASVSAAFALAGARVTHSDGYPGWKPNLDSPLLKLAVATYRDLTGREPEVKAIHAGLECGIIGTRYPGMDMVSFGPTLEGVHSPDERLHIGSVARFWEYLLALLKGVR